MNDKEKKAIEKIEKQILIGECEKAIGVPIYISDLKIVLNIIENQKAEIEDKDREIIRLGRKANEYKKAINCKDCDCCICEAHINTLELRAEIEKKDKIIHLMAEDKYENINMLQMANIGKEVNYDPTKLFNGIPDEEAIKIIKQYFEKKAEEILEEN